MIRRLLVRALCWVGLRCFDLAEWLDDADHHWFRD